MIELIVALLGAGTFLVIYNKFLKGFVTSKQVQTEKKAEEINKKVDAIKEENTKIDEETKTKVEELEDEKNKPTTTSDLADFFNNRKS